MTKDDRFSMSAVLKYRKNIEEGAARDAALLRKRLEDEELLLMALEGRKESAILQYRKKTSHTVEEINIVQSFLSTIDIEIACQKKKVSDMVKNYDRKREELISAAMDKKIMETMRDREWDQFTRMIWGVEQKNMDEVAVNSYCRNQ